MTAGWKVPFNRPSLAGDELGYIRRAVEAGHLSGDGPLTRRCNGLIEDALGGGRALLTTSCTHALEMSALLLGVGPGDEVVVPSFTFVSTANAFALRGARVVFADVRPDTLNLDERILDGALSERTRAVVAVHYAGVGCEMEEILSAAGRVGASVVEDNAHGLFGTWRGRMLGRFGRLAAHSFHETKNITCGEGGALVVNDPGLVERAEIIREKGTDRSRFFRGLTDKYTWVDLGSSYLPSEILAAFLLAQLEAREQVQEKRRIIWERYHQGLSGWAGAAGVGLPAVPPHCGQSYHMFYLMLPSEEARESLREHLNGRGILAVFHYLPLHLSEMGRRFGGREGMCPVAEDASRRLLRLPFFCSLSRSDQDYVVESVLEWGQDT